uniref:Uncharacterized protein n=1 Tax=Candidatus Kentrum sp. MB TaxID=2138164 RepID=A0A451BCB8_9GAMM|nr:MAG: hypothetical protein BECKMB1821G_GA0114241_102015 [Candidatus Kentron sp. MB]VFK32453.1 MAG: hypothetical protein BECKMB1821I_GA0114274_103328 [Candidatus Kentron sp. MB]VFK75918.1 MAG: hypothetical protein BECKMB1821H_GA0114242_103528 [Candidatus Kentron sp. MB]
MTNYSTNPVRSYFSALFEPDEERRLTAWLFLKLLALIDFASFIYFTAFFSLSGQIAGLVGAEGILPYRLLSLG